MSGLIQKVDVSAEVAAEVSLEVLPDNNGKLEWYWDENAPGSGDRPDWLESKYNKVADQAKAYKELEKMLGKASSVAPEDYDLNDYNELFDLEHPTIAELKNRAKELKLPQESFKKLVDGFAEYHKSLMPNTDAEIAKLGEHAQMRINTVNTWASNHLSDKSLEALGRISNTAEVVELIDEIRQLHLQTASKVPGGHIPLKAEILTPEMVQQEIVSNYDKYKNDPQYRRELNAKMQRACGDE